MDANTCLWHPVLTPSCCMCSSEASYWIQWRASLRVHLTTQQSRGLIKHEHATASMVRETTAFRFPVSTVCEQIAAFCGTCFSEFMVEQSIPTAGRRSDICRKSANVPSRWQHESHTSPQAGKGNEKTQEPLSISTETRRVRQALRSRSLLAVV